MAGPIAVVTPTDFSVHSFEDTIKIVGHWQGRLLSWIPGSTTYDSASGIATILAKTKSAEGSPQSFASRQFLMRTEAELKDAIAKFGKNPQLENTLGVVSSALEKVKKIDSQRLPSKAARLTREFETGVYARTFSDLHDEVHVTLQQKLQSEKNPSEIEPRYWSSSSAIQKNFPCFIWTGMQKDRTGFILSSKATLGGWNVHDMGTENPPSTPTEENRSYFPSHFPDFAFGLVLQRIEDNDEPLVRTLLGLSADAPISPADLGRAQDFVIESMDPTSPSHKTLLDRLPPEVKSYTDMAEVSARMKQQSLEIAKKPALGPAEYNEAKIHYMPDDILGVIVTDNPASVKNGESLQLKLASQGITVPLARYSERDGSMVLFQDATCLRANKPLAV
jgi:hypothetical protein